jgi:hypothetical protein
MLRKSKHDKKYVLLVSILPMSLNSPSFTDIYSQNPFDSFVYSRYIQIYYIISGILSIFGNFYIVLLFVTFKKLRKFQCNWIITYLSAVEIFIGNSWF